jgi:hypothetical protein
MSLQLTNNQLASFDKAVKHAYQGKGMLRGTVKVKTGIVGATHQFQKMGKGMATPRVPQTDVVPMNIGHSNAVATLTNWNAPEYTDIYDAAEVNYSEQAELAETIANAMHRREDQMVIDALDASGTTNTVAKTIGGNNGMNTTKCRAAMTELNRLGVPSGDRTMVVNADGLNQLLGTTPPTSSDFASVKALVDGDINTWLGFTWITMDDRDNDEGGLPLSTNDRTAFAYHKGSTGLAVGLDRRTEVNYIPTKTSWLANGIFKAGAVAIDAEGIVDITYDQSVTVDSE